MKVAFCGTPEFAVPTLEAVLRAHHEVALVVTQPDRPSGRGMQVAASPIKQVAIAAGIAVEQPLKLKTNDALRARLEAMAPDAILVVAYGRIIPAWMLELPRYGNINLHGSLLPKYRGAAPIQWAVAQGEPVTGVTTMRIDAGLDTGDMLLQRELTVGREETAAELYPRLAQMGAGLMIETLAGLKAGTIAAVPQDHARATLAPILTREDGRMEFGRSAEQTYNRWRGFQPWPGAWAVLGGKKFTVTRMVRVDGWEPTSQARDVGHPGPGEGSSAEPGALVVRGGRLYLACGGGGWVELVEVQVEGKRSMSAGDFLRGNPLGEGARLG